MSKFEYTALLPKQSDDFVVFTFCAKASDIFSFAHIDRIGRLEDGTLRGFQRPQVENHIKEIRNYLAGSEAVLPNSVVLAFTDGVTVKRQKNGLAAVTIDVNDNAPGFIVDGQQRLTALSGLEDKEFEVLVSCILCKSDEELRKQFILINNTKPLPKQLIYELLPTVQGLPKRLSSRSTAAKLIEMLNYREDSSLKGQIKQHTNPTGALQDTVLQKFIIGSLNDGVLRQISKDKDGIERSFLFLSTYYLAIQKEFEEAWKDHKPKSSRLVHGAGLMSLGFVMEYLHTTTGASTEYEFRNEIKKLHGYCAWTDGYWEFGEGNQRPWNGLQYVPRDYMELTHFLISILKNSSSSKRKRRSREKAAT